MPEPAQDPHAAAPRLIMRDVRKTFGPTVALGGVSLDIRPGEVHALIGENGAGKSTLMKVLSGAHRPDSGEMVLDGAAYAPATPAKGRDAGVAMIYQELTMAQHLSVQENLFLGQEQTVGPVLKLGEMRAKAKTALERVGLPHIDPDTRASRLSNAQLQLIEIARSLIFKCRVLVLDEPTSSLTAKDIEHLFSLIRQLRAEGVSIIYISHFLEEVRAVCDRYTVLRDGRSVGTGEVSACTNADIVRLMVGREVADLYPRSARTPGEVVLELSELASAMGKPASASLQLRRGEILGIAGLMGAGRTELIRAIFGLDRVASGQIRVGTFNGSATPAQRWKNQCGMLSEDRKREGLALNLSIADNLTLPWLKNLGPMGLVFPGKQTAACKPWIEQIPIKCSSAAAKISSLSGGNQQKVAIARLLHARCDVLLLDEPTRGIDVGSKAQIYALLDQLSKEGKAILMVSSYLPELMGTCDRIAVMSKGRLFAARPVGELTEHDIMVEAIST